MKVLGVTDSMKMDPTIEMLLSEAIREKMYGSIELKFESGRFVLAKVTETIKPPSGRDNREAESGR